MIGISGQAWLEVVVIAAILLGGTIGAILTAIERRKRRQQHNSHRRPRSWDHIEEQWPSPAASRAIDDTGSMNLDDEIGWRRRTGNPWPLQEPADFDDELPFPELLDDLPDDPDWPAKIRAALDDEEQERLAHTGELRAIEQLDEDQLAELLGPDPEGDRVNQNYAAHAQGACGLPGWSCPWCDAERRAAELPDVTADTFAYVDDLAVLTRYRIPAE